MAAIVACVIGVALLLVDTDGVITWTPTEAQGPSTNVLTTIVSNGDDSVTNNFVVEVTEVNVPPTYRSASRTPWPLSTRSRQTACVPAGTVR